MLYRDVFPKQTHLLPMTSTSSWFCTTGINFPSQVTSISSPGCRPCGLQGIICWQENLNKRFSRQFFSSIPLFRSDTFTGGSSVMFSREDKVGDKRPVEINETVSLGNLDLSSTHFRLEKNGIFVQFINLGCQEMCTQWLHSAHTWVCCLWQRKAKYSEDSRIR